MVVLWFYLVMATGSYNGNSLSHTRPEFASGPFKTEADCRRHRGGDKDGVSQCVSVRVRWSGSHEPPWSWVPPATDQKAPQP